MLLKERLSEYTKDNLLDQARSFEIRGCSGLRKAELIDKIVKKFCTEEMLRSRLACLTKGVIGCSARYRHLLIERYLEGGLAVSKQEDDAFRAYRHTLGGKHSISLGTLLARRTGGTCRTGLARCSRGSRGFHAHRGPCTAAVGGDFPLVGIAVDAHLRSDGILARCACGSRGTGCPRGARLALVARSTDHVARGIFQPLRAAARVEGPVIVAVGIFRYADNGRDTVLAVRPVGAVDTVRPVLDGDSTAVLERNLITCAVGQRGDAGHIVLRLERRHDGLQARYVRVHRFLPLFQGTNALGERIDVVVIIFARS